jgi:hypothetical protein
MERASNRSMLSTAPSSPKPRRTLLTTAITLTLLSLALALHAHAQDLARRLILKDGSYQLVTQYEVKGERVRYKSAERDEWEELPSALVDWPATEKYEKDRSAAPIIPEAAAIDKETDAEREAELVRLPQVAPGLRLPEVSGIFLLDNFQGQPQLVELQQTEGDVAQSRRPSLFRTPLNPVSAPKQTIELDGEHAALHAHVAVPSLYINSEDAPSAEAPAGETASAQQNQPSLDAPRAQPQQPQQPQQPEHAIVPFDRFHIVRLKVKNGRRILADLKRAPNGKVSQNQDFIKTTINNINGGWLKLTPTEDLTPGEYALIETKGTEGMNLYVWDFNVNPTAPSNANPWKPEVKPETKPADPPKAKD